jgi:hypothetical protein
MFKKELLENIDLVGNILAEIISRLHKRLILCRREEILKNDNIK